MGEVGRQLARLIQFFPLTIFVFLSKRNVGLAFEIAAVVAFSLSGLQSILKKPINTLALGVRPDGVFEFKLPSNMNRKYSFYYLVALLPALLVSFTFRGNILFAGTLPFIYALVLKSVLWRIGNSKKNTSGTLESQINSQL